jgi:hypothetical protein
MNKPNELECEVMTPDGQGKIISMHTKGVLVAVHKIEHQQPIHGQRFGKDLHFLYRYSDVEIIKGFEIVEKA